MTNGTAATYADQTRYPRPAVGGAQNDARPIRADCCRPTTTPANTLIPPWTDNVSRIALRGGRRSLVSEFSLTMGAGYGLRRGLRTGWLPWRCLLAFPLLAVAASRTPRSDLGPTISLGLAILMLIFMFWLARPNR